MTIETTFAMIKSKAVNNSLRTIVMARLMLSSNIVIARAELRTLTDHQIRALYSEHKDKPFYPDLVGSVSQFVYVMALEGENVITQWRDMMGPTDPKKAPAGTLRWLARDEPCMADNVVHGSDSKESADRELLLFFGNDWFVRNVTWHDLNYGTGLG